VAHALPSASRQISMAARARANTGPAQTGPRHVSLSAGPDNEYDAPGQQHQPRARAQTAHEARKQGSKLRASRRRTTEISQPMGVACIMRSSVFSEASPKDASTGKISAKRCCSAVPCYMWPFLVCIDTIGPFSTDAYLPNLVQIGRDFNSTPVVGSLSLQLNLVTSAMACMIVGTLADRFGRKRVLLSCFVVYTAGAAWAALSGSIFQLIAARVIMGFGQGSAVLAQVITRDLVHDPKLRLQVMASLGSLQPVVIVTAPAIGGTIGSMLGWRWVFWLQTTMGALMAVGATLMQESQAPADDQDLELVNPKKSGPVVIARRLLCSRVFMGAAGLFGLMFAAVSAMLNLLPYVTQQYYGLSVAGSGAVMGVVPMFIMGGASLSMVLSRCLSPINLLRVVMLPPFLLVSLLSGSMWLCWRTLLPAIGIPSTAWLPQLVPCVLMVVINGIFMPVCQTLYLEPFQDMAGAAAGAAGLIQNVMMAAGSAFASGMWDGTPGSFHATLAFWMAVAQVWFWSTLGTCPPTDLSTDDGEEESDNGNPSESNDESEMDFEGA